MLRRRGPAHAQLGGTLGAMVVSARSSGSSPAEAVGGGDVAGIPLLDGDSGQAGRSCRRTSTSSAAQASKSSRRSGLGLRKSRARVSPTRGCSALEVGVAAPAFMSRRSPSSPTGLGIDTERASTSSPSTSTSQNPEGAERNT